MSEKIIQLPIFRKVFYVLVCLIVFSGCVTSSNKNSIQKTIDKKDETSRLNEKKCTEYLNKMHYASSYIQSEFEKGYFDFHDVVGAKAQLFLIENNSPSIFAQNINAAEKEYILQYTMAKKNKCSIKNTIVTPLSKIKNILNKLDNSTTLKN